MLFLYYLERIESKVHANDYEYFDNTPFKNVINFKIKLIQLKYLCYSHRYSKCVLNK